MAVSAVWVDALTALGLFAVDPPGLRGVALRAQPGPPREEWLALLHDLLPAATPLRRVPAQVGTDRLLGGLDLAATLQAGRPVAQRGLLLEADGGIVVLAMAERLQAETAAQLAAVLDNGEVRIERDGLRWQGAARIGVVALDEGIDAEEAPPAKLLERLAFRIDLRGVPLARSGAVPWDAQQIAAARARLAGVLVADDVIESICAAALTLGIDSTRASLLAVRAARASAALAGRGAVSTLDAQLGARMVLGPRATQLPAEAEAPPAPEDDAGTQQEDDAPPEQNDADGEPEPQNDAQQGSSLQDVVLDAAQAAIPADLLLRIAAGLQQQARGQSAGRVGVLRQSRLRGRPAGVRRGAPRAGKRLSVIDTLRAAAPWQRLRRDAATNTAGRTARVQVRAEDFHVRRYKQRAETATIFILDASGSSALHRLAEAKGAIELLLVQCYVRRDRVAVIAFRGTTAQLLLPPTRSLVRARRSLAGLPGGGGTPLAAGIDAGVALAESVRRAGMTPTLVLLTDGRANITREGAGNRGVAEQEALAAARRLRAAGIRILFVDTAPRPQPSGAQLARELGAQYLPLPYVESKALAAAVLQAGVAPGQRREVS